MHPCKLLIKCNTCLINPKVCTKTCGNPESGIRKPFNVVVPVVVFLPQERMVVHSIENLIKFQVGISKNISLNLVKAKECQKFTMLQLRKLQLVLFKIYRLFSVIETSCFTVECSSRGSGGSRAGHRGHREGGAERVAGAQQLVGEP